MRTILNKINMRGQIVIGEVNWIKHRCFIGEKVGTNNGPELDIAADPLEGTNFVFTIYLELYLLSQYLKNQIYLMLKLT